MRVKCDQCRKEYDIDTSIVIGCPMDGARVCSKSCETAYIKERNDFFTNIVHSEEKCEKWLLGEINGDGSSRSN